MSLGRRVEVIDEEQQDLLQGEERVEVGEVQVYQSPRLNFGQRLLGGTLSFVTNVSAATVGTVMFRDTLGANAGVPGDYAFTAIGLIVGDRVFRIGNSFTKESSPFAYMRAEGDGNVGKGIQNEMGRVVVAAIPALAITLPASYCRQMLFEYLSLDPANNLKWLMALSALETPAMRSLTLGAVSLGTFFGTLKLLDKCVAERPDIAPDEQPKLIWVQSVGGVAWETLKTLLIYEAVRELMRTNTGPLEIFQTEYSLWAAPALAMFVQGLSHLAERPRPFVNINPDHVPNCGRQDEERVQYADNEDPLSDEPIRMLSRPRDPGKCRQLGNASLKLIIGLGAVTAVIASAHQLLQVAGGQQEADARNHTATGSTAGPLVPSVVDPNVWDMGVRIGVEAAMIGAYYFISGAVDLSMTLLNKAGSWCSRRGMFGNRQHQEAERQQQERETLHSSSESATSFDL